MWDVADAARCYSKGLGSYQMRTILVGLLASFSLLAQGAEGDYSIAGTVLNSVTGEPVKGALVTLTGPVDSPAKGRRTNQPRSGPGVVRAGGAGEYQFAELPKGQYFLTAQKPGFTPHMAKPGDTADFTGSLDLNDSVSGHTILLDPLGVIEGTIVNQYGDPLGNVSVGLFQYSLRDGAHYMDACRTAVTNDRGRFRIWDLPPGKYYVKAMGRAGGTAAYVGDSGVRYDSWEGFRPVYFGGTREMSSATPLTIAAGTQARADFTVAVEPTYKIRGVLQNFTGRQPVSFELLAGEGNTQPSRVSLNATNGRFSVDDVPSGRYTLRATIGMEARGETAVNVQGEDANDISIALAEPVTVTTRVVGPAPDLGNISGEPGSNLRMPARRFCNVNFREPGTESQIGFTAVSGEDPEFPSNRVFAGQYRLSFSCPGGYVVSAVWGSSDLLANPEITIQPGQPPPPIEINMKAGGSLRVKLAIPLAQGTGVLLVPEFTTSTGPVSRTSPVPRAQDNLVVAFADLAPGDYVAYALPDLQSLEYRRPEFLHGLTGGTNVHIDEGQASGITLTALSSVPQ